MIAERTPQKIKIQTTHNLVCTTIKRHWKNENGKNNLEKWIKKQKKKRNNNNRSLNRSQPLKSVRRIWEERKPVKKCQAKTNQIVFHLRAVLQIRVNLSPANSKIVKIMRANRIKVKRVLNRTLNPQKSSQIRPKIHKNKTRISAPLKSKASRWTSKKLERKTQSWKRNNDWKKINKNNPSQ